MFFVAILVLLLMHDDILPDITYPRKSPTEQDK